MNALDPNDWDFDDDGVADNYFEASTGEGIETSLLAAIRDIMERAASGTAAAVDYTAMTPEASFEAS